MRKLKMRLLALGISPVAVERYVQELTDHREDLIDELIASGMTDGDAEATANRRLGDVDTLAQPMLADPRFLSLAGRAPLLVWICLPVITQAALVAVCAAVIVASARTGLRSEGLVTGLFLFLFLMPLVLAWSFSHLALRRYLTPHWPVAGVALTLLIGASLQLQVTSSEVAVRLAAPDVLQFATYAILAPLPLIRRRTRTD